MINRRKKNSRLRGSHTHGWGSKKKHRGAGNRGGRGMAGTGKRAGQKKSYILKFYGNAYFGRKGFKTIMEKGKGINIGYLDEHLDQLLDSKAAKMEGNSFVINLSDLKAKKLLGKGSTTKKLKVIAASASRTAVEKIKKSGGEVVVDKKSPGKPSGG